MTSARIMRTIETVLDQAEAAVAREDWDAVAAAGRRVIAIDPANEDATAFLRLARADLDPAEATPNEESIATVVSAPLLAAIEEEVRVPALVGVAGPGHPVADPGLFVVSPQDRTPERILNPILTYGADAPARAMIMPVRRSSAFWHRRFIVVRSRRPRRRAALLWRGPLVLTACVAVTAVAFVAMGDPRGSSIPSFSGRPAESAPAGEVLSRPVVEVPDALPFGTPVTTPTATATPNSTPTGSPAPSAPASAAAPVVVVPPPVPASRQYAGTFSGSLGRITALNRCEWAATFQAQVNASVTRVTDGTMTGTAASLVRITYAVTETPPDATCHASEVSAEASGSITGDDAQVTGTLQGLNELAISFQGAPAGDALAGN
ncbi:MAG: hypothetical protein O2822_05990, partial [Chloroflexi bacterium]|nr:hypothetical protein [Chloroflexota bacterium]